MEKIRVQKQLLIVVHIMMLVIIATIALAWAFYPENYLPLDEYISNLGGFESRSGYSNTTSMIIMAVGFGLTALIGLVIAFTYVRVKELDYKPIKFFWAIVMSAGAIFVAVPKDSTYALVHYIGAFVFIMGFAILNATWQTYHFYREHETGSRGERLKKFEDLGIGYIVDFTMVYLVFFSIFIYIIVFILEQIDITTPLLTGALMQKIVLGICCIAVLVLDREDM